MAAVSVLTALLLAIPAAGAGAVVPADGDAPLAEAGLDQQVLRGETVRLDATGSFDPDGQVVEYEWEVRTPGGLTVAPSEPHGARTSFPATAVGRYRVTLTVTDDDGKAGTDTMYVRVGEADTDGDATDSPGDQRSAGGGGPGRGEGRAGVTGSDVDAAACSAARGAIAGGCSSTSRSGPGPWARIEGPRVVKAGHSYTYTASAGGLSEGRTYAWEEGDTGRRHTLAFRSPGEYTARVTVEDAKGRTATDRMEVFVSVEENDRPDVEIVDPGRISAGERLTLSVDADDPDGRIRTTEWSPGRRVRVPTDGSSRTVRVTVTDDDGASVTDAITISGRTANRTLVGNDTTDVTCYFTDERQRDGRHPYSDRCIPENGETVSLTNGPTEIEDYRENEKIDLQWRRTTQEQLDSLDADDTSTDYGVAAESPQDEADTYGYSDDLVKRVIVSQRTRVGNDESFELKGETVEDDLTGDGEVDAADWDQRHRTTGDTADVDPDADATTAFKRSTRNGGTPERVDDGSGVLETSERASADAIRGRFAGTSIDAENRRDRVADVAHRTRTGDGDGRDPDERGRERGSADGSRDDADDAGDATDAGRADRADSTDEPDDTGRNHDTHSTDDTGGIDTSGGNTGSTGNGETGSDPEFGDRSRHSPHGGRIVAGP
ncbi:MAG: PKD domain-containing protein [Haloarculaceae archaeon]